MSEVKTASKVSHTMLVYKHLSKVRHLKAISGSGGFFGVFKGPEPI